MKHAQLCVTLVLLAALLTSFAPNLEAQAKNCVPDSGCPQGEGPPSSSCCEPPPCEFQQALKFERANLMYIRWNMYTYGDTPGFTESDWVERNFRDYRLAMVEASPCPFDADFEQPPVLWVDQQSQCEIMLAEDYKKEYATSLDALLAGSNSCEELVQAESKRAEARRQSCLTELYRSEPRTLSERMLQDEAEAQAKVDELEEHQRRYEQVCTVAPDSTDAQKAVEDDLAPLVPAKPPKAKKKKAKRWGNKAERH